MSGWMIYSGTGRVTLAGFLLANFKETVKNILSKFLKIKNNNKEAGERIKGVWAILNLTEI